MIESQHTPVDPVECLSILARAPADQVKRFADALIPQLEPITVVENRTGLIMLPMKEPVQGAAFYLGEVLVAEARVLAAHAEGYAACLGRDHEQALAIALVDAANAAGLAQREIGEFVSAQAARLRQADEDLLRQVEATRVEMETFEWLMPT